ncbi:cell wall-active antibiotics response protein LiaF [Litchfieldia alkalitelluris]|uniref:cell wall-active antibiotics response protein LiaF n=1 Tax=Litchfieldia alkalitelluris TaxID=304268 RepID=UPI000996A2B1|nr:cell wall-active antibiotics response protein LiaF [Litchfieldia alkalitelluris]
MQFNREDFRSWMAVLAAIVVVIEVTFFNHGVLFSALISGLLIYFGSIKYHRTIGKIFFWFGIFSVGVTILTSSTFKVLLIAIIIYFIIQFFKSKKAPQQINPVVHNSIDEETERIIKKEPFLSNPFVGKVETPEHVYEWQDINIHMGFGDAVIDLSNTVLPEGESVISIRNVAGNITLFIPYELEVMIHHSSVVGGARVFQHKEVKSFNQTLSYQTADYQSANQKVKIITSMIYGELEVKRR